jgi:hypothetical protein
MFDAKRALRDLAEYIPHGFADAIGYGLADAIVYAEDFGDAVSNTFKQLAATVIAELAKIAILKMLPFAQGGTPLRAAAGLTVTGGQPGMDSVPALLMPGETVIDRSTTRGLAEFLETDRRIRAAGAPSPVASAGASAVNFYTEFPHNAAGEVRLARRMQRAQRRLDGGTI